MDSFEILLEDRRKYVTIQIIHPGDATNFPRIGSSVSFHYKIFIEKDKNYIVVDSSFDRSLPISCIVGNQQVIAGIECWLPKISKGTYSTLLIPSELAYGTNGYLPLIPPNSHLKVEIQLLAVNNESAMLTR